MGAVAIMMYKKEAGCIIVGRKTFEQYHGEIYPLAGVVNTVYTHRPEDFEAQSTEELKFVNGSPADVLKAVTAEGFEPVILGGGSETNGGFAKAG